MTREDEPNGDSLAGRLIIAMPNIGDPRFERSVVYLLSHKDDGAMGLIVNRSTGDYDFDEILDQLELDIEPGAIEMTVRFGGPVEVGRPFILHSNDYSGPSSTMHGPGEISVTSSADVLEAMAERTGPDRAIFVLGYAGWGPGQLEREILENVWLHCEADNAIVFDDDDETKWTRALAKIGVNPSLLSAMSGSA